MRRRTPAVVFLLAALTACSEPGQSPSAAEPFAPGRSSSQGATTDSGEDVFTVVNEQGYLDCVGEEVRFNAAVPYRWNLVTTADGRVTYRAAFIPHTQTGTAVGQSSGRVWTLDHVISPEADHFTSTRTGITVTALQMWARDGGPTMQLHTLWHFSQDAAGETMVDNFVFRCNAI